MRRARPTRPDRPNFEHGARDFSSITSRPSTEVAYRAVHAVLTSPRRKRSSRWQNMSTRLQSDYTLHQKAKKNAYGETGS